MTTPFTTRIEGTPPYDGKLRVYDVNQQEIARFDPVGTGWQLASAAGWARENGTGGPEDDAKALPTEQDEASEKAWDLADDAISFGALSRDLGVERVIALAQVYATLATRP